MEIDDLKKLWVHASAGNHEWSEAQLTEALRGKSTSVIGRMKKSIWFEIGLTCLSIVILALLVYYLRQGPVRWLMVALILSYVPFCVYYLLKMRLLARFDFAASNLKTNLTQLVQKMETFLRFYRMSYRVTFGLFYGLAFVAVYFEIGPDKIMDFVTTTRGIVFVVGFTSAMIACFLLIGWYVRLLYGKHLTHLKELLAEINTADDGYSVSSLQAS